MPESIKVYDLSEVVIASGADGKVWDQRGPCTIGRFSACLSKEALVQFFLCQYTACLQLPKNRHNGGRLDGKESIINPFKTLYRWLRACKSLKVIRDKDSNRGLEVK